METPSEHQRHAQATAFPRVLVSVLSHNSPALTRETLHSLRRQTYPNFTLQLIDNASTADVVTPVRREFPDIQIKQTPENVGYTGGNNIALDQALAEGYDYVLLCNHDLELDAAALACLVETAQARPAAGAVGGIEVNAQTGVERAHAGAAYSMWTARAPWTTRPASAGDPLSASCVHGALVLLSARALRAGVRFDERLFLYFDEVDLGFQLRARGLAVYVDARVKFIHKRAPADLSPQAGYLMQRNRAYMVGKYGRWYHKTFYHLYVTLLELPVKYCMRSLQGHRRYAQACVRGHLNALIKRMGAPP